MNKRQIEIIKNVLKPITRKNKTELQEVINNDIYSLDDLKVIIPSLLPPYSELTCDIRPADYKILSDNIATSIAIKNNAEHYSDKRLSDALKLLDIVQENFKEERKETKDLYDVPLKTHLTAEQHERFIANKKSYNYRSNAAFLRDVALNQVEPRPNNDEDYLKYFKETKELSKALQVFAEDIEDADSAKLAKLNKCIKELKKNVDSTRKLAIDSHSSATAKILALKYLSSHQLDELCKQKMFEEAEL
ncbi:chromosome partitioning protein ParA [Vibrio alginolyticus]|nr:chromosome partitioning protein ParA [Vibrio alginolyticus]